MIMKSRQIFTFFGTSLLSNGMQKNMFHLTSSFIPKNNVRQISYQHETDQQNKWRRHLNLNNFANLVIIGAAGWLGYDVYQARKYILKDRNESEDLYSAPKPQEYSSTNNTNSNMDLNLEEVGGYNKQLLQLIREIFYSRAMGFYSEAYGIIQPKGVILYGPPGTGKTNIARAVSKSFPNVVVIRGPELKHPHVGRSETRLRKIFEPALQEWKAHGNKSNTYIYIFDEIDSLFPKRTPGSDQGAVRSDNSMISQLLTLLDGVDSPKNIIVIGTTNQINELDPALLRPGRLEVQIEINLPNEQDREKILFLKTKIMRQNNLLDKNVDLKIWADKTKNFTGAEIEFLVKKATHYAMESNFKEGSRMGNLVVKSDIKKVDSLNRVTQEHFQKAFGEIRPSYAVEESEKPKGLRM